MKLQIRLETECKCHFIIVPRTVRVSFCFDILHHVRMFDAGVISKSLNQIKLYGRMKPQILFFSFRTDCITAAQWLPCINCMQRHVCISKTFVSACQIEWHLLICFVRILFRMKQHQPKCEKAYGIILNEIIVWSLVEMPNDVYCIHV